MEVKYAEGIRRSAPLLPEHRVLLKDLWENLPEEARQRSLVTLSQIVARQLFPPEKKEAGNENS